MTSSSADNWIGYEAIDAAKRTGRMLSKFADPVEGAREGLNLEEAREIARFDPGLIFLPYMDGDGRAGDNAPR